MEYKYFSNTIKLLNNFVEKFGGEVIPCTFEEVNQLESMLPDSYHLPAAYKEFLLYGGKAIGKFYEEGSRFDYKRALDYVTSGRSSAISLLKQYETHPQLPDDIYVLTTYMSSYFNFFKLTEGENPPVYEWNEEDEIGTEAIVKAHESFTDFIVDEIRMRNFLLAPDLIDEMLEVGNAPKGRQFWLPVSIEYKEGVDYKRMMRYFGFIAYRDVEQAASILGLDSYSYLEELSGWKAIKVGDEVRFFPPSYESPEEKEKKALEQQNKLESKKQELASVEKT